ncbi:hypothetical protein KUCAC02_022611 [Chaenocephalus aceratus]|uniref:Uncharacterized protein n=1 Tax=Chaenocephalus aceratus TaxID=36190 RepID=A0ACB9XMI2_CHAAC|nr:hypothetical protein KUCAC02_022611 [Chaenocephalus aceratus]
MVYILKCSGSWEAHMLDRSCSSSSSSPKTVLPPAGAEATAPCPTTELRPGAEATAPSPTTEFRPGAEATAPCPTTELRPGAEATAPCPTTELRPGAEATAPSPTTELRPGAEATAPCPTTELRPGAEATAPCPTTEFRPGAPAWSYTSAQQLCPAVLQGDTGGFVHPQGEAGLLGEVVQTVSLCVHTVSFPETVSTRSVSPPRKTALQRQQAGREQRDRVAKQTRMCGKFQIR